VGDFSPAMLGGSAPPPTNRQNIDAARADQQRIRDEVTDEAAEALVLDRIQNDSNRDNRIAITFENLNPELESDREREKFTERSIERDINSIEERLKQIRNIYSVTAADRNRPEWFSDQVIKNRTPRSSQELRSGVPGAGQILEDGIDAIQRWLGFDTVLEQQLERIPYVAINSVTFRSLFGNNPSEAEIARRESRGERGRGTQQLSLDYENLLQQTYDAAQESIIQSPNASDLEAFIGQSIQSRIVAGNYGRAVIEGYSTLEPLFEKVQRAFTDGNFDWDRARRSEEEVLLSLAVENFTWFYYAVLIVDASTTDGVPVAINDAVANDVFTYSTYYDFERYINQFVDLIYRSRIHAAIEMIDEELERLTDVRGISGLVDENGLYTDEGSRIARERLPELLNDLAGTAQERPADAADRRLAEQCFLIDYLPELARLNQRRAPYYNTFTMVQGKTDTLMSKLIYNENAQDLDLLTPAEVSSLVPKVRIFKVLQGIEASPDVGEGTSVDDSDPTDVLVTANRETNLEFFEQEVPFHNYVQQSEIDDMMNGRFSRGAGSGIKSFDWKLEGLDPFAARRDVGAELKVYFQSMDVLLTPQRFPVPGLPRELWPEFRYIDLVNMAVVQRKPNNEWNPNYYRLRAEVGWSMGPEDVFTGSPVVIDRKKRAIQQATKVLYLDAIDHALEITDQGEVHLTITYLSTLESSFSDRHSDILATSESRRLAVERDARISAAQEEDPCNAEQVVAEIQREYVQNVRELNFNGWRRILDSLYANERIFVTRVPTELLDANRRALAGGTNISGLLEAVFGPRPPAEAFTGVGELTNASGYEGNIQRGIATPGESPGSEAEILQRIQELAYSSQDDYINVQYFFFGDLIDATLNLVAFGNGDASGESRGTVERRMKLMLGPISFKEVVGVGSSITNQILYNINIADIPISVPYYIEWFLKTVVGQNRTVFPALEFIRKLTNNLLRSALRDQCAGLEGVTRQNLLVHSNHISVSGDEDGADPFESSSVYSAVPNEFNINTRIDIDRLFAENRSDRSRISPGLVIPSSVGDPTYHYMVLYSSNTSVIQPLTGRLEDDADGTAGDRSRGIYHFGIGKDRGMLKRIKFTKTDDPYRREMMIERNLSDTARSLVVLATNYDVTLTTIGNPFFQPGQMIYIDPTGIGESLGSPTDPESISRLLGIGGYHRIFRVSSYIESGKYETTLDAAFEVAGGQASIGSNQPESAGTGNCNDSPNAVSIVSGGGE